MQNVLNDFRKQLAFSPRFYSYVFPSMRNRVLFAELEFFKGQTFSIAHRPDIDELAVAHKKEVFIVDNIKTKGVVDIVFQNTLSRIYPEQTLLFAAKIKNEMPEIVLHGTFQRKPMKLRFSPQVDHVGQLAPRAFAELAVKKMQEKKSSSYHKELTALCRYFSIPGKSCSLLMLESQRDYKRFGIRTQKDKLDIHNFSISRLLTKAKRTQEPEKRTMFLERFVSKQSFSKVRYQQLKSLIDFIKRTQTKKPYMEKLFLASRPSKGYIKNRKNFQGFPVTLLKVNIDMEVVLNRTAFAV